ncbi:MAG: prolipoprotein diacylglyceryl transferase [Desulfovibrionaceae bacterium]
MHPILIDFGPLAIHTYGLFIAVAFLLSIWWGIREARLAELDTNVVPDLALIIVISAMLGARLLHVLLELPHFLEHPLEAFMIWRGGLVFSGGLFLAVAVSLWFMKRRHQPLFRWLDVAAPAITLGQAIGRIGCFFAGCCYGLPTNAPWAVTFHDPACLAPLNIPLHPTQLYHSVTALVIFGILVISRKLFKTPGQRMGLYLVLYPASRFVIEFYRDDYRGYAGPLSVTQVMVAVFFCVGLFLLFRKPKGESV